ncbi:MAG: sulfatase-like hydrolase/transferase, partial [Planctomycetota bacterium]
MTKRRTAWACGIAVSLAAALSAMPVSAGAPADGAAPPAAGKAKRAVIFVVESVNADEIAGVPGLKTMNDLAKQGAHFKDCYICPPTRTRGDKVFGTVVTNLAIVTGTVFWTKGKPFSTLGDAGKKLGPTINLAAFPSYNCLTGFSKSNTKAGKAQAFFDTSLALYKVTKPSISVIHPQDPGEGGRDDLTSPTSAHIKNLLATDARIGKFLAALKDSGELADTIVVVTSDHGYVTTGDDADDPHPPVNPKCWRVPLIIAGPGVKPGEHPYAELIDIAPTVCHLLGIPAPTENVGRVLAEGLESPPEGAAAPKQNFKKWLEQNKALHAAGKSEKAADFYGHERFL